MAGYEPVESIQGISSLSDGQQKLDAIQKDEAAESLRWKTALEQKQAAHTYSCYILVIQVINHLSLDKIDGQVIAESQMMNIEQAIQSKMVDISQFISKIQSESTSYTPYVTDTGAWSPDSFLGLKQDFYEIGEGRADWGQEHVSADYQTSMDKFISAFKELFYCNTNDSAPTVGSLSKIVNPNVFSGGQDFDLTNMWKQLQGQYSVYDKSYSTDMAGNSIPTQTYNVISANPNDKASLIQQYMYYKAQLAVDGDNSAVVDNAHGDITQLIDFGTDQGGEAFVAQAMQMLSMFNSSESVGRSWNFNPWMSTQTGNILDMILLDQRMNYTVKGTPDTTWRNNDLDPYHNIVDNGPHWGYDSGLVPDINKDEQAGLYGAFSYAGFNYFWTKATTTTQESTISKDEVPYLMAELPPCSHGGQYTPDPGPWDAPYADSTNFGGKFWTTPDKSLYSHKHLPVGVAGVDILTGGDTSVNGVITNLGTITGTESTKMQELTSNEGENVNIAQNAIKSMNTASETFSQNQIDA